MVPIRTIAVISALAAGSPATLAHPHVWVDMQSTIVFTDDGLIKGVDMEWTFDDAYAQMALDGLDMNKDGFYSQDEIAPLTKENIDSLKDYEYFTVMRANGEQLKITPVTDAGQIYSSDKLTLHFQVPLATPLDPRKAKFTLKVYDPEFFVDLEYSKDDGVDIAGNMPKDCKLAVKPVPTDAELEQTRTMLASKGKDWKPDTNEDFGAMFAQPVSIECQG
jgi:ABC-type uncharacterized transport system substrate-binding protein